MQHLSKTLLASILTSGCLAELTMELSDGWNVKNSDSSVSVAAAVPGCVHSDLIREGILEDPDYRFNEREYEWVALDDWTYSVQFETPTAQQAASSRASTKTFLEFDGIDTLAEVKLNGLPLARTHDMFLRYSFDVTSLLLLGAGQKNHLEVSFVSPMGVASELQQAYPYGVPATKNYNVWLEPSHRSFVRKAGSDFGWDWGPAYVQTGLWGAVRLRTFAGALLSHVTVVQQPQSGNEAVSHPSALEFAKADLQIDGSALFDVAAVLQLPLGSAGAGVLEIALDDAPAATRRIRWSASGDAELITDAVTPSGPAVAERLTVSVKPTGAVAPADGSEISGAELEVHVKVAIPAQKVQLWWPRGYGEQPLYNCRVSFTPDCHRSGARDANACGEQTLNRRVGIRRVSLIRDNLSPPQPSEEHAGFGQRLPLESGTSYFFEVNGTPLFARGANVIPPANFHVAPSRLAEAADARPEEAEMVDWLILSALLGNMNMLRVWGGGMPFPTRFYERADETGLLLWQEAPFACALYPNSTDFLGLAALETTQMTRILGSHASVAIWGGNNENEAAIGWFIPPDASDSDSGVNAEKTGDAAGRRFLRRASSPAPRPRASFPGYRSGAVPTPSRAATASTEAAEEADPVDPPLAPRSRYVSDYLQLYVDTMLPAVREVDPFRPFVDSSPSNGVLSEDPYVKVWGDAGDVTMGDIHFYDYNRDCADLSSLPLGRFVSEFGWQGMPSLAALARSASAADLAEGVDSELLAVRQRHEDGYSQMSAQIAKHFRMPAGVAAQGLAGLEAYIYLSQLQQALCYETSVAAWRRAKAQAPYYTMGTLYWQLNGIWAGPEWSSMDGGSGNGADGGQWNNGGAWRPLHYLVRRFYAPLLVSVAPAGASPGGDVDVFVTSDVPAALDGDLTSDMWQLSPSGDVRRIGAESTAAWSLPALGSAAVWHAPVPACEAGGFCFLRVRCGGSADDDFDASLLRASGGGSGSLGADLLEDESEWSRPLHSYAVHWFTPFTAATLPRARVSVVDITPRRLRADGGVAVASVTLETDMLAVYVTLTLVEPDAGEKTESGLRGGFFSDNVLPVMLPAGENASERVTLFYVARPGRSYTVEGLRKALVITTLADNQPEPSALLNGVDPSLAAQ